MPWHAFIIFIFGACVGSFLNVVILRHNSGDSFLKGGSRCFSCGKNLKWYELIPIFSFLIQKGRCRGCGSKISIQYPAIETATGLLFLLTFFKNMGVQLPYFWVIVSLLIVIAVYDLRHKIIPDLFVWLFNGLAFLFIFFENSDLLWNLLSGIFFFSFFALLWLISGGRWMGLGDAKLALGLGWFLGPEKTVLAFLFSFWLGALFSVFLLLTSGGKFTMKSKIPFGPFLVAGSLLAFFLDINLMNLLVFYG